MTDKFVYSQKDLDLSLNEGCKSIILCAGIFNIPLAENTVFRRLGPVKVTVLASQHLADDANMRFIDINPCYINQSGERKKELSLGSNIGFTSFGSFHSLGSYRHYYEYEFEYNTSFSRSFPNSFLVGYSFSGSYSSWENLKLFSEYASSKTEHTESIKKICVFGYGIDLI